MLSIAGTDPQARRAAVTKLGMTQNPAYLPIFEGRLAVEKDPTVVTSLHQAIAITRLAGTDAAARIAAIDYLSKNRVTRSLDFVKKLSSDSNPEVAAVAKKSIASMEGYLRVAELWGTLFRGLSLGSILLVAALGLAITFGLMGVINMAHGEIIVVGAYTTYLVQNIFGAGAFLPFFGLNLNIPGLHRSWGCSSSAASRAWRRTTRSPRSSATMRSSLPHATARAWSLRELVDMHAGSLRTICDPEAVTAAGFVGNTPEDEEGLVRLGYAVFKNLRADAPKARSRKSRFNTQEATEGLDARAERLKVAAAAVTREKREEQGMRAERDAAWAEFDRQVRASALGLEALFRQAGMDDLADRLVPTRRAAPRAGEGDDKPAPADPVKPA